jgi:hypothetical protein
MEASTLFLEFSVDSFEMAMLIGERDGVKLEIAGGIPTWEAFPAFRHQEHVDRVRASIRPMEIGDGEAGCACIHAADVYVRFPDGSMKRPDISIFCRRPTEETTAITLLPEAVIEILSPTYEAKDLVVGVPFYLSAGIKDVLVLDPETLHVSHFRPGKTEEHHSSPALFTLECGCQVTV